MVKALRCALAIALVALPCCWTTMPRPSNEEGIEVDEKIEESEFGKFGWVMDPEGNKLELWEPPAGQ